MRLTFHEDRDHDVWKRVYGGQNLYDWLLSHAWAGDQAAVAIASPRGASYN